MANSNRSKQRKDELRRAVGEIADIKSSLTEAYSRFDSITDPELMDACIYEISALRSRYDYAVRRAKARLS